ncbi:hypothetical protein D3C86_2183440 [compost metagenome]
MEVDETIGDGELDDDGHGEDAQGGKAGTKAQYQEDRQDDLAHAGKERHGQWRRIGEGLAKDMQTELLLKEIAGA